MTHTPGPWFVGSSPDMDGESGEYGPAVYDSEVGVFAVIDGEPETVAQPYLEADACLIAAAPDMLAALLAFERATQLNNVCNDDPSASLEWMDASDDAVSRCAAVLKQLRDAGVIAKTEETA